MGPLLGGEIQDEQGQVTALVFFLFIGQLIRPNS